MMKFKIINIEKDHKDEVHRLIEEINKKDNLNYSLTEQWLDYVIENAGEGIFLAFHEDRLVGLATAMINSIYKDQGSFNVVVSPDYRGRGVGTILYDRIYNFAKDKDVKLIEAYVKKRLVDGVEFAEKRGFNTTMYSWEMELGLAGMDHAFKKLAGLNFRKADRSDSLNYKKIINDVFGDGLGGDALMQILKDPSNLVYFLEKEGKAIGSATVQLRKDLSLAYIYDIAILKDYRRQGLGTYLLRACLEALNLQAIDKASLLVTGDNSEALELYRKVGFKQTDVDLIMVKRLE